MSDNNSPAKSQDRGVWLDVARFFNHDPGVPDGSSLKVAIQGQYFILAFSKYNPNPNGGGANNPADNNRNVKMQFETFGALNGFTEEIIRDRVASYREGKPYKEVNVPLNVAFMDTKDGTVHTIGVLRIHTVKPKDDVNNRIAFSWEVSDAMRFTTVLGSKVMPTVLANIPDTYITTIDPVDTPLYRFGKTVHDIMSASVLYAATSKLADLITGGGSGGGNNNYRRNDNDRGGYTPRHGGGGSSAPRANVQDGDKGIF